AELQPDLIFRQVQFIVHSDNTVRRNPQLFSNRADGFARQVHKSSWASQDYGVPGDLHRGSQQLVPVDRLYKVTGFREQVINSHVAHIVAGSSIFRARIASTDHQPVSGGRKLNAGIARRLRTRAGARAEQVEKTVENIHTVQSGISTSKSMHITSVKSNKAR